MWIAPSSIVCASRVGPCVRLLILVSLILVAGCSSGAGPSLEPAGAPVDGVVDPSAVPEESSEVAPTAIAEDPEPSEEIESTAPLSGDPVLIGVLLDTTNLMASIDRQPGIAFVRTIERIGAEGGLAGRPVEVEWVNTTSRMSVVDAAAQDLIERGASLLVVTCEAEIARPAIERAREAGVLVVSPCGPEESWGTGELGPLAFSMSPSARDLGATMAEYVWGQGHRNVAVLVDETAPEARGECRGFRSRFEELGGRVRDEYAMNPLVAEALAADTARLESLDRDSLVLCSAWRVGQLVLASVRGQGLLVPIIAGPSLDSGVWIPEDVGIPLRDFTMLTLASVAGDDPSDAVIGAAGDYLVADGVPPSSGRFVLGADLAAAYRLAVERAGTLEGDRVADEFRALDDAPLVSGEVTFGGRQAPVSWPLRIMGIDDGVFVNDGVVEPPGS